MISKDLTQSAAHVANQASRTADHAIDSTRNSIHLKMDDAADAIKNLQDQAAPLLDRASEAAKRGVSAARDTSNEMIAKAGRATDSTVNYIKDEPVKAILIAAATGAALMAMLSVMSRSNRN